MRSAARRGNRADDDPTFDEAPDDAVPGHARATRELTPEVLRLEHSVRIVAEPDDVSDRRGVILVDLAAESLDPSVPVRVGIDLEQTPGIFEPRGRRAARPSLLRRAHSPSLPAEESDSSSAGV